MEIRIIDTTVLYMPFVEQFTNNIMPIVLMLTIGKIVDELIMSLYDNIFGHSLVFKYAKKAVLIIAIISIYMSFT